MLITGAATAQQYQFQHFDARHGVPGVRAMTYDAAGLLWIGTTSGLVRYDGHQFRSVALGALRQPVIEHVTVDPGGAVWVLTRELHLYRVTQQGHKAHVPLPSTVATDLKRYARVEMHMHATTKGLLLAAGPALWQFSVQDEVWQRALTALDNPIRDLYALAEGTAYLATEQRIGVVRWGTAPGSVQWLAEVPGGHAVFVRPQAGERVWVGTEYGLYLWSPDGFEDVLGPRYRCWPFATPALHTDGGLAVEIETNQPNPSKSTMEFGPDGTLRRTTSTRTGQRSPLNRSLVYDREGGLWLGSSTGVSYLEDDRAVTFSVQAPGARQPEAFRMLAEHPADSALWISTYAGIFRLKNDSLRYLNTGVFRRLASPLTISRRGDVFWQEDPFETQFYRWSDGRVYHEPFRGVLVAEHTDGTRLFARQGRLYREPRGERTAIHGSVSGREWVWAAFSRDGRLWLHHGTGLDTVVGDSLASALKGPLPPSLRAVLEQHRRLPRVFDVVADSAGNVWLGVEDIGLIRLWKEPGGAWTSRTYGIQDGLLSSRVHSIQALSDGRLWLGTLRGVQGLRLRASGALEALMELRAADGLPNEYIKDVIEDRSGYLWIGTDKPVLVRYDLRAVRALASPAARISGLEVNGRPYARRPALHLRADTTRLTIELASNSFRQTHRVHYQYRLLGLDSTWTAPSAQRSVQFAHLPPGRYTFQARAVRERQPPGPVVEQALALAPPFHQAGWFYAVCGAGLLALVGGLYAMRVRRLTRRQRDLEAEVAERTAQLRAQARRLAELDAAKNRFFANVSHEFRTPLTLILSPLEEGLSDDPAVRRRQERSMRRSARRLLRLVGQLLDLAKLEGGRMKLHPRPGELAGFLERLVRTFQPLAERRQIVLTYQAPQRPVPLVFDPDALEKIVGNLLANALKFTPEGGKVYVSLTAPDAAQPVTITVKDTGPGIPPDVLPHVFERFRQADDSATRSYEGTGLGLALARELATLHGGTLLAESEPGFGSTFTLELPQEMPADEAGQDDEPDIRPSAASAARAVEKAGDGASVEQGRAQPAPDDEVPDEAPTILIVEDHAEVRALVRGYLASDYHVLEASDGQEGLAQAREHAPDLIVADVMMPNMDGITLIEKLRRDERLGALPVLLLTARAEDDDAASGLQAGATDYLAKPFSAAELRARIARHLAVRRELRERFSQEVVVEPAGVAVPSDEQAFIEQVRSVIEAEMADTHFGAGTLADAVGLSPRQLRRRLREALGESPSALIRRMRLERAAQLLEAQAGTVAEIAYQVGFKDPAYFSTAYRKHFGHVPSTHFEE